jgi:hypothetical protein
MARIAGLPRRIYRLCPPDKLTVQSVTPSQIYQWEGLAPDVELVRAL